MNKRYQKLKAIDVATIGDAEEVFETFFNGTL